MKIASCAVLVMLASVVSAVPVTNGSGKLFAGIEAPRMTTVVKQPPNSNYSVRFVPLITLLAGMFPNFFQRLGQFTGVNKYVNTRNNNRSSDISATPQSQNAMDEDFEEEDDEHDLIECDGAHLGLWPVRSDTQKYYKCEIDPRTPASADCIGDIVRGEPTDKQDSHLSDMTDIPRVKPCFFLSMMKCANGFKYQHKSRICVPDIVFASQSSRHWSSAYEST